MKKSHFGVINTIDLVANRILYAIYEVWLLSALFINWFVYWVFVCPLDYIKKKKKKGVKIEEYKYCKSFKRRMIKPKYQFLYNQLSLFIFFLPLFLLLNVVIIILGNPLSHVYNNPISLLFLLFIAIGGAGLLCDYFFWNKNRYLKFFSTFRKESLAKRIVWVIGAFVGLFLLAVIDLNLMFYIMDINR